MLSKRLQQTTLHMKISCPMLLLYSCDNIAQVKTLFNVTPETPDNIVQETQCTVVWTTLLFCNVYFGPVNFLIITGCCKWSANIPQNSPTLRKKNTRPGQHWTKRQYCTKQPSSSSSRFVSTELLIVLTQSKGEGARSEFENRCNL